jgi:hypothetical protein
MWRRLHDAFRRLWRQSRRARDDGRLAENRARFWAEVQQGQREAEADSRS